MCFVVASCASGVALVLILIGVAGAVRCRRAGVPRPRASKRLAVTTTTGGNLPVAESSPFDAVERDADISYTTTTVDLVDCVTCQQQQQPAAAKHRRGRVMMNGVKAPARSPRKGSDESSVCTQQLDLVGLFVAISVTVLLV